MGNYMEKSYLKWGGVGILAILILFGLLIPTLNVSAYSSLEERGYTIHDPFRINSDSAMQHMAAAEGWSGSGSLFDPYIIEKYEINAVGYSYGIYIGNTTLHFTIRNCLIYNVQNSQGNQYFRGAGILLTNVTYGSIVNNIVNSNIYGISLVGSSIIYLSDNQAYDNTAGIEVNSDYVSLYDNQVYDNDQDGILIYEHSHNIVTNNTLTNNPLKIYGYTYLAAQDNDFKKNRIYHSGFDFNGDIKTYTSQNIDTTNTVNDKPVYYYKNYTGNGATISPDAGQIILANATDLTVNNVNMANTSWAIIVAYSSKISVLNSNLSYSIYGIFIEHSSTITINSNELYRNGGDGIYVSDSQDNTIMNNICKWNTHNGIKLWHSDNNKVQNNICLHNQDGIFIEGDNNFVDTNNCSYDYTGISLMYADDSDISNNEIFHNSVYGISVYSSHRIKVDENTLHLNDLGIRLLNGGSNKVWDNTISGGSEGGITISNEDDDSIYSNTIDATKRDGISVSDSSDLSVYLNKIGNSTGYGISVMGSKRIRIYSNEFYYNHGSGDTYDSAHIQAYDDGVNYWNGTVKGNYWQDWPGPDDDNDGIVDEPYLIDGPGSSKDFYPIAGVYIPEFSFLALILIGLIVAVFIIKRRMNLTE